MWTHLGFSSWRPQLRLSRQMLGYATRAYRTTTLRQHSCGTGSLLGVTHEFIGLAVRGESTRDGQIGQGLAA